jgi:hypothetical protein
VSTLESKVGEKDHQYYQDLVGGAAIGILTPEEHAELDAYMRTPNGALLGQELAEFMSVVEAIPISLDTAPAPSSQLRNRLQAMIEQEVSEQRVVVSPVDPVITWGPAPEETSTQEAPVALRTPVPTPTVPLPAPLPIGRRSQRSVLYAMAALVLVAILAGALIGRFIIANDDSGTDSNGEQIALSFPTSLKDDSAELTYFPDRDLVVFSARNLPALPDGKVYQAWLIGTGSAAPVPMGAIIDGEYAAVADTTQFQTFAVTVEPGPIGSAQPTSDPVVVASLPTG